MENPNSNDMAARGSRLPTPICSEMPSVGDRFPFTTVWGEVCEATVLAINDTDPTEPDALKISYTSKIHGEIPEAYIDAMDISQNREICDGPR